MKLTWREKIRSRWQRWLWHGYSKWPVRVWVSHYHTLNGWKSLRIYWKPSSKNRPVNMMCHELHFRVGTRGHMFLIDPDFGDAVLFRKKKIRSWPENPS